MLPSLTSSRPLRLTSFTSFYVAQGVPMGLITVALPTWLASNGVSGTEVGSFLAIAMLPWGFKLIAGPVMDRFRFPALGNRRPWVMVAQTGLLGALLALALVDPSISEIALLTVCCFVVSTFAAVQDVAVDGMAIDVLPTEERGRANALMAFGQVAGIAVSGAACGWTLVNLGLSVTAIMLAVLIAAILAIVILFRERDGERLLPWTPGSAAHPDHAYRIHWGAIGRNLFRALILPASLLLLVVTVLWRASHGIYMAAVPVLLTQDIGWDSVEASSWISISQFVAALLGVAIGPFIDRHGARVFLSRGLVCGTVVFAAIWLATPLWEVNGVWIASLFVTKFVLQVLFVAYIALHMSICWSQVAATQFAMYMAWANLAYSFGAQVYAWAVPVLDGSQLMLLMSALFLASAMVLAFVDVERHHERLDRLQAEEPADDALVDVPAGS
jgi:PAT family beta-lactamase induction signal transducer AmpG